MMTDAAFATISPAWGPAQAVTAQSDAWLIHPSTNQTYLLSLVGSVSTLRRIRRAFVDDGIDLALTPPQGLGRRLAPLMSSDTWRYRAWWGRLLSGVAHLILVATRDPAAPDGPRLIFARSTETLPAACFEILSRAEALMGVPAWASWLFRRLVAERLAVRLAGPRGGPAGCLLHADEADLDRLITEGLRQGALAFPGET